MVIVIVFPGRSLLYSWLVNLSCFEFCTNLCLYKETSSHETNYSRKQFKKKIYIIVPLSWTILSLELFEMLGFPLKNQSSTKRVTRHRNIHKHYLYTSLSQSGCDSLHFLSVSVSVCDSFSAYISSNFFKLGRSVASRVRFNVS